MSNVTIGGTAVEEWTDAEIATWILDGADGYKKRGDTIGTWVALMRIFDDVGPPMTVRQVFYRAESGAIVEKSEKGYKKVQYHLLLMRRQGVIPYSFISDATRWMRKPTTYDSVDEMLQDAASSYRRSLWTSQNTYAEIWLEKNALAGVFEAAEVIKEKNGKGKECYVFHFGDFDPSGVGIGADIEKKLNGFGADVEFQRMAVIPEQITNLNLPTRPTKGTDSRAKSFGSAVSVELDAIHPNMLRQMIRDCIDAVIDPRMLAAVREAERMEQESLKKLSSSAFMARLNETFSH